jgi:hypothetical protein
MPPPRHRLAAFSAKLNSIVAPLRQLHFTYAQGKEMSRHQALDAACGVTVYFRELHLAVATRHLQKHQRLASPVSAQRHRPIGLQSGYQHSAANRLFPALRWWLYNALRAQLECREGNVAAIATRGVRCTGLGLEASKSVQEKDHPGRNGRC